MRDKVIQLLEFKTDENLLLALMLMKYTLNWSNWDIADVWVNIQTEDWYVNIIVMIPDTNLEATLYKQSHIYHNMYWNIIDQTSFRLSFNEPRYDILLQMTERILYLYFKQIDNEEDKTTNYHKDI